MDIKDVKEYVELLNKEGLTKLKVEGKDILIHIEKEHPPVHTTTEAPVVNNETSKSEDNHSNDDVLEIKATQVGTIYLEKEEGQNEQFVQEGDTVSKGDKVALIEAMKVFNEVTSEFDGEIENILVQNGDTVEYDQVIMTVKKG